VYVPLTCTINRHDLSGDFDDIIGHQGMEDFVQLVIKAIPDYQIQIEDIFAKEDRLAMRFTAPGTHRGDIIGYHPTGKKLK
jgi:predicted ester cyclase